jgi:hypothetical protein
MGIWYSGRGLFNAIQHRSCVRLVWENFSKIS